jgi:hypothetical protein
VYGPDLFVGWLAGRFGLILGGDQDPSQLDDHVEVGRVSLGGVPGCAVAAVADDAGVVAGEVVRDDDDALRVETEGYGAFDGLAGAVACFADAGYLFGVFEATSIDQRPA